MKGHESYYWVHNDSGDLPRIFALHESGVVIAEVAVTGAQAVDWEDIAAGPSPQDDRKAGGKDSRASAPGTSSSSGKTRSYLYLADTGNNDYRRTEFSIYRIPEPELPTLEPGQKLSSERAAEIRFRYPERPFDCEAMVVHPETGNIYLITKPLFQNFVYRCRNRVEDGAQTLVKVGALSARFVVTAADLSPDGRRLLVRTYLDAEEYRLSPGKDFEEIFRERGVVVPSALSEIQGECIAYDHAGTGYVTAGERPSSPIHHVFPRKQPREK